MLTADCHFTSHGMLWQLSILAPSPSSGHLSIVLGHRQRRRDIIPVEPMDTHAITLFEKKLGAQATREAVLELTTALEFMPLAIVQAAAYIKQRLPRLSVTQYLESFRRSDHQTTSLLYHEGGHLRRDPEAKNSILITWQISFDYILQKKPIRGGFVVSHELFR
jgi:hypothetical protein